MAATTASSSNGAVWSFGLGGMEEDESEDFSMFQPVAADDADDAKEVEALEPTEETLEESAEEEEEEEADVVQPVQQQPEPPHEASESSLEIEPAKPTSAVWSFGLGGTEDEDEDDDDEDGWGATVVPTTAPILEEGSQDEDDDDFVKEDEKEVLATPPSTPPRTTTTSRQAQTPPSQLQQPPYYSPEEDEPEESMEFIPVSQGVQGAPASPAGFTINEDEEVNDTSMTFVSPVTPPKKSVGSVLGRRPQTVGSLSRPRFSTQIGRERMTPGSLLSKMTPKGAFKRASDIAAISHNKKQGDKQSRADRLMSIQSSFRHLDLNDSTNSLPNMSAKTNSAEFKTPNNLLPPEDQQDNEPEEPSEHRDSDTSAAILPNAPMDSEDFESSRNTMTESSETSIDIVPTPPAEELSPEQDAKKKKKSSSKSKSPKGSRKTKKLDDEASTATKKKKKKGLKKAIKLATAPAVAMTELVRDTSTGMSDLVKSTAKEVSNRTSELGESLGMNNKNDRDKKKKKKSKTDDDATAASKKKKKPKSSKSLSPVPTTERKKKSKRKLVDGRQGLPTATERPLGNLEKQDSFGSNRSAQSCHSFS